MTAWPKGVQNVEVSTVIKPVTQTAETDVKSAGISASTSPSVLACGSSNRPAPSRMTARKPTGRDRTGCSSSLLKRPSGRLIPFLGRNASP